MARLRSASPPAAASRAAHVPSRWGRLAVPAAGLVLAAGVPGAALAQDDAPGAAPAAVPAASPALPSTDTLQAALLTATDLGQTFSTSTDDTATDGPTTYGGCKALQPLLNGASGTDQTEQGTELQVGDNGPFLTEGLLAETPAKLTADYARDSAALKICKTLSITSDDTTLDFTLSPITFTPGPSAAVRLDGTVNGVQTNGYLAVGNLGDVEVQYFYLQVGSGSSQLASSFFTKAVTKAQSTLASPAAGSTGPSPSANPGSASGGVGALPRYVR
ncbi:MAG TPA: hypothetical protein VGX23_05525 [Actinocrinis sp.]|nr:hypothetical protein [Actinocrinis sp.]